MIRCTLLLSAVALGAFSVAQAADGWSDVEARIQYGWYTEDLRSLRGIADSLASGGNDDPLRDYYRGLVQYRLLLITIGKDKDAAKDAAEACVDRLADADKARKDFPDGLALQAGCMGILSGLKPWKAVFLGSRSTSQLERALKLEPRNPRVILLDALADYERPKFVGGDKERAFGKFKLAVEAFEAERQGVSPTPGWGAPEAYAYLGRSYLDRGDAVAAREALERALLLAPEFELAKSLMAKITTG
jgi:tetratricopeptide (TPR) repeat protein